MGYHIFFVFFFFFFFFFFMYYLCFFFFLFIFLAIRNGILVFYFKYYLDIPSMMPFLDSINKGTFGLMERLGMAGKDIDISGSFFGITNLFGQLACILGIIVSNIDRKSVV